MQICTESKQKTITFQLITGYVSCVCWKIEHRRFMTGVNRFQLILNRFICSSILARILWYYMTLNLVAIVRKGKTSLIMPTYHSEKILWKIPRGWKVISIFRLCEWNRSFSSFACIPTGKNLRPNAVERYIFGIFVISASLFNDSCRWIHTVSYVCPEYKLRATNNNEKKSQLPIFISIF